MAEKNTYNYQNNLGRDLTFLSRDLSRRLMVGSAAKGHEGLKLNWDTVFLHLDFQRGSRIVDLAQLNGLSKQAMSQIVADIEQHGYVSKQDDPEDGRARKIVLTAKGKKLIQDSMQVYAELEAEYARLIGSEQLTVLKSIVEQLVKLRTAI